MTTWSRRGGGVTSVRWPDVPEVARTYVTHAERGRAARAGSPRSGHGAWEPPDTRTGPVTILMDQASSRIPELVPVRNTRMLSSAFAFYRGSAAIMAADLAHTPTSGLQVQLCGDAHLSNFGGYASPDRQLVFDLTDFDETLAGPWEWDVKRLMASLVIAGRDRGFDDGERATVVESAAAAYRQTMREMAALTQLEVWYSRLTASDIRDRWGSQAGTKAVRQFDRQVAKATTKHHARAVAKLTETVDGETRFRSDPPLIVPVSDLLRVEETAAFEGVIQGALRAYRRSLTGSHRHLIEQYRYVDVARKVVGVGSVGTRAWVVLLLASVDDTPLVLQLKEARTSVLAPFVGRSPQDNQGHRVVVGQQLMQASSDIFLGWVRVDGLDGMKRDFYVRQLWDWKVSPDVGRHSPASMAIYGQLCGWVLARAHARSGERVAIAAYLGSGNVFDVAMVEFAEAYADQNQRDYDEFAAAAREGRIEVSPEH